MARILGRASSNDYVRHFQHTRHTELNGRIEKCSAFGDLVATIAAPSGDHLNVFPEYWSGIAPDTTVITVQGIPEKTQAKAMSEVEPSKVRRPTKAT